MNTDRSLVALSASLDIALLRTFLTVVDTHSFASAADLLALTPSAVSGHIKRLEDDVAVKLLSRTTRRLSLTAEGEILYTYARNILSLEREARAKLRGAHIQGRIRVGSSEDFAGTWLAAVLQSFSRSHPRASIELKVGITSDLVQQRQLGQLDVVFGKQCSRVDEGGELLWEEPLVWAYAAKIPLDTAIPLPLAVFPEPCVYREAAIQALALAGTPWRLAFESSSMAGCIAAALAGFAVTPIARSQLRDGLRELGPAEGLPALANARFHAFSDRADPAIHALIESVQEIGRRRRFIDQ
ncbi:LysR family transcriptional regulator [Pseudomonas gingeri NCPPB 3146 = LMG 5327]|uniref:LysR family transcriptional regulator n=2 Tax=Pseudomonas gingeri TaxID=117681 RepID=A0A7Y8CB27_9PSED|nr:LysR substrate-binding domain-containing protein [Pseudomonas gingeri]NVZ28336.1 LysR family transcriptional regulator [Pseudomonas gingeri]NVZ61947.1 LysR family transcriptional regulator [Pseudomonas gingeri]NVZ73947.1 LysR family transcriptional regulator [Pseudomonas gingeri]NWA09149.1 LysR family transcriptional regulator [Pseudomonas gingeri]NWC12284.1 LysR family transcriptional regulator [Pseudomonas gingeri]